MATVSSSPQSVDVSSKITVTMPQGSSRFTRTSNTGTGSVYCSVSVPAGSTINSATFSCTTSGGTLYGGTTKINGTTVSGQGPHYVGNGTNTQITVSFSFKSTAKDGDQSTKPSTSYTQTRTFANCILTVDYTPPTAPSVWGVTLDGSTGTQYRGSNAGLTLNWSAQPGTNNPITSYSVHASDNGGAWYWWGSLSPGSAVTAHPTQGNSRKWLITPVAPYGNGAGVESPTVYTYSYPTAPAISISPSSCYTGDPVTFSFSGASGGTGVSISSYSLYPGNSDSALVNGITGSSYASTAPATAGTYTYRMRSIGSVSGYNSGYSNTITLVVSPRQSSFTVNNAAYPNLGQQLTATVSPVNSGYTHKIKWQATNDPNNYNSGGYATISAGVTTATFTPPLSWAKAEPSSPNTIGITVLLQTWNGASQVGTNAVVSFSSNIPASVKPQNPSSSGATFTPNPALSAFGGVFLVGNSKLQSTLSYSNNSYTNATSYTFIITPPAPQSQYSSTVSTPTYTTANTLSMAGTYTISAYATDARGRSSDTVAVGSITVYDYTQPSFNVTYLSREPAISGTQFRITATVTVDKRNPPLSANAVSATHVFRAEWREKGTTTWTTTNITSGTPINLGSPNIALNKAYEVRVSAGDKVYETRLYSQIYTVPPVVRQFDFRNDRASLGKIASDTAKTFTLPDDWTTNIVSTRISNANLLHNWDFRNPVNQRGMSGAITGNEYFYDRWLKAAGTAVNINSGYINIEAGAAIRQRLENPLLYAGKTFTLSILTTDGTVHTGICVCPSTAETYNETTISDWGSYRLGYYISLGYLDVRIVSTASSNVQAVKLELGTVSTLHLDPPVNYSMELLKCQRFYQKPSRWGRIVYADLNIIITIQQMPTTFRVSPTATFLGSPTNIIVVQGVGTYTPTSVAAYQYPLDGTIELHFSGSFPGSAAYTSGGLYVYDKVALSADL